MNDYLRPDPVLDAPDRQEQLAARRRQRARCPECRTPMTQPAPQGSPCDHWPDMEDDDA